MKKFTRIATWGEALLLEVHYGGGLNPIVNAIRDALGRHIGVRNTFANLYKLDAPPTDPTDRFRAWLVLTALEQDVTAWGLDDAAVPSGYDRELLREQVISASRCRTLAPV